MHLQNNFNIHLQLLNKAKSFIQKEKQKPLQQKTLPFSFTSHNDHQQYQQANYFYDHKEVQVLKKIDKLLGRHTDDFTPIKHIGKSNQEDEILQVKHSSLQYDYVQKKEYIPTRDNFQKISRNQEKYSKPRTTLKQKIAVQKKRIQECKNKQKTIHNNNPTVQIEQKTNMENQEELFDYSITNNQNSFSPQNKQITEKILNPKIENSQSMIKQLMKQQQIKDEKKNNAKLQNKLMMDQMYRNLIEKERSLQQKIRIIMFEIKEIQSRQKK